MRLFHKELEAYLVAEGLFEEKLSEEGRAHVTTRNQWKHEWYDYAKMIKYPKLDTSIARKCSF